MHFKQRRRIYVVLTLLIFFSGLAWIFAPFANHILIRGPNLISEYESVGMPYGELFRLLDFIGASSLLTAVWMRRKYISKMYGRKMPHVLAVIGGLAIIDTLIPVTCHIKKFVCTPQLNNFTYIHGAESYLLGILVFGLACYVAFRFRQCVWLPFALAAFSIMGLPIHGTADELLFSLQAAYTLLEIYLLWHIALGEVFNKPIAAETKRIIQRSVSLTVVLSSVLTILSGTVHLSNVARASRLLFVTDTAWLSQHTFLTTLALLFLARALRQGSVNAWRAVTALSFLEIINFGSLTPDIEPLLVFLLLFVVLLMCGRAFDKQHSTERFIGRLKNAGLVIALTALGVTLYSGFFHWFYYKQWERSAFTPGRVIVRTLLIEVSTNPHDSLRARLFGQVLTATGIFLYSWLFFGLFLPALIPVKKNNEEPNDEFAKLLQNHSNNSEDAFKLWPPDKSYWFNHNRTAAVAYKQSGAFLLALADPICAPQVITKTIKEFSSFAKQHGATACWVMIRGSSHSVYRKAGLRTIPIGASAVVSTAQFSQQTVKSKWWRWARNKSIKGGITYEVLTPPHADSVMRELATVSEDWLAHNKHKERTFALGYFDIPYLQNSVLHVAKDTDGKIIAFANQLPVYNNSKQITIDLMRYKTGHDGLMAFLLSELILHSHQQGYTQFDLGFVPLAHTNPKEQGGTKALLRLSKKVLKPVFSAQGLEQFKNKFDPTWEANYLAWDGDILDIALISAALQRALNK